MRIQKKFKLFIKIGFILLLVTFSCNYALVLMLRFNQFVYWSKGILERFVYAKDTSTPIFSLSLNNQTLKNHMCIMPILDYEDKNSVYYLDLDYSYLKPIFNECDENKDFDEILTVLYPSGRLLLDKIKLEEYFKVEKSKCFAQQIDKKLNSTEETQELVNIGQVLEFHEMNLNYELNIKRSGVYYVFCVQDSLRKSTIYSNVKTVLVQNMTDLIENRKKIRKNVANFKRQFNYTNEDWKETDKCFTDDVNGDPKMNVLILGIDSVSYNHFKRIFPLTFSYLNDQLEDNVVFNHFNSVGGNTYPNMLAMLCGLIEENMNEINYTSEIDFYRRMDSTFHDHLPFIWNDFEKMGYVTMYQEDDPSIAIFNYYKKGFRYWPTTLYDRSFWTKYYEVRSGPGKCHYKKPTYLTWMDQIESFLKYVHTVFDEKKRIPYFSFNFLTEMTHMHLAIPKNLDLKLSELLIRMNQNGYLDNTMLILMSDHGNRLNYFAYATETGKLERNLPFLSIKLPKKMRPTPFSANLKNNKNKLVSFFDVYQTLRHFLHVNKYGLEMLKDNNYSTFCTNQFCTNSFNDRHLRGISLFVSFFFLLKMSE